MDAKQELINGLNEDLAYELSAINQYIYNAAVVSGLARLTLRDFFAKEAQDEMVHAQYLAEKIATLGGEPMVEPKPFSRHRDVKGMLEATVQAEIDTIQRYTKRIEQAEAVHDIELKTQLEDMIADETKHKEEMQRLLEDPRL
ncbi:ferritin-like domain-containing protein [Thermoactinomyces daqus]|jgi:bacterioferritin|uniref:Ferritin-like domain-containing protein n=1 Tax=Thermoactinomyces daqus TaxID=1329516 RepID=A0A7W2AI71_9BACL|nr:MULTISPECIES: ferritin-like domain-containing protein [Thermoactinomyces]MBA4543496.1 ferritin-like domain-containing protein [Thermoactinomyces daqus]MBH8602797.1 ferritin-like domain-containing protein [Thermoactinomyces sp. CICC 10522]